MIHKTLKKNHKYFGIPSIKLIICILSFIGLISKNVQSLVLFDSHFNTENILEKIFSTDSFDDELDLQYDMLESVEDFVNTPEGGTPWEVFADTGMNEYTFEDKEGFEWTGVRPQFTEDIKMLEDKKILIQGYMFPLDQDEKQKTFLLIPFPVHCPYYPHATSNLIIEVHATKPILFSYDPINIEGKLELVPRDDLYNVFFRIKNANLASN